MQQAAIRDCAINKDRREIKRAYASVPPSELKRASLSSSVRDEVMGKHHTSREVCIRFMAK
jgi:hypothetical protein